MDGQMRGFAAGAYLIALTLGACTVGEPGPLPGDTSGELGDTIRIEHPIHQVAIAQAKADSHCGARGKRAVRVQTTPSETSAVLIQTSISTFACVP